MLQRSFTWLVFLVLLLLAGLLIVDWQDTLVNQIAMIEVDNRSGRPLERIEVSWSGSDKRWPGVEDGQSALLPLVVEKPGEVTLVLYPSGASVSGRLDVGQRLYVRVEPETVSTRVSTDPSLER